MTQEAEGQDVTENVEANNNKLVIRLVVICLGMFGFAYALVPLYEVFCEVTGLNGRMDLTAGGRVRVEDVAELDNITIDTSRTITVEFVADAAPGLNWRLEPETTRVTVHPGEMKLVNFYAENLSGKDIVARAVPSISPGHGAGYFKKTQCFCFDEMSLAAGQKEEMPVVFHLTEDFPKDIRTVTLAYKAFDITDKVKVIEPANDVSDSGETGDTVAQVAW